MGTGVADVFLFFSATEKEREESESELSEAVSSVLFLFGEKAT